MYKSKRKCYLRALFDFAAFYFHDSQLHSYSGIPIGTPFRKAADFVYLFFLTTYRGPHQPDIRPRGETKKPRRLDPMRPLPLCNA